MTPVVYNLYPISRNGDIVYEMIQPLGAVTQANLQSAQQLVGAAATALPGQPVTHQSNFSKIANTVGTIAGLVAVIPGIGWVAAAVCGIVAGVCLLLGKIFGNSKAKKYEAERKQYEIVNAQIRYENEQLDLQYPVITKGVQDLRVAISGSGVNGPFPLYGLGSKASRERDRLQSAKDEYDLLSKEQTTKSQLLMTQVDEFNKLMKAKFEIGEKKSMNTWLAWILGGSAAILTGYYALKKK